MIKINKIYQKGTRNFWNPWHFKSFCDWTSLQELKRYCRSWFSQVGPKYHFASFLPTSWCHQVGLVAHQDQSLGSSFAFSRVFVRCIRESFWRQNYFCSSLLQNLLVFTSFYHFARFLPISWCHQVGFVTHQDQGLGSSFAFSRVFVRCIQESFWRKNYFC